MRFKRDSRRQARKRVLERRRETLEAIEEEEHEAQPQLLPEEYRPFTSLDPLFNLHAEQGHEESEELGHHRRLIYITEMAQGRQLPMLLQRGDD